MSGEIRSAIRGALRMAGASLDAFDELDSWDNAFVIEHFEATDGDVHEIADLIVSVTS